MSECSCSSSKSMIRLKDFNGQALGIFIKLCDGRYFGGRQHDLIEQMPKSHAWLTLDGMLDLIAKLANATPPDGFGYALDGHDWYVNIKREMQASDIAKALGCDPRQVVDHFGLLVKVGDA